MTCLHTSHSLATVASGYCSASGRIKRQYKLYITCEKILKIIHKNCILQIQEDLFHDVRCVPTLELGDEGLTVLS